MVLLWSSLRIFQLLPRSISLNKFLLAGKCWHCYCENQWNDAWLQVLLCHTKISDSHTFISWCSTSWWADEEEFGTVLSVILWPLWRRADYEIQRRKERNYKNLGEWVDYRNCFSSFYFFEALFFYFDFGFSLETLGGENVEKDWLSLKQTEKIYLQIYARICSWSYCYSFFLSLHLKIVYVRMVFRMFMKRKPLFNRENKTLSHFFSLYNSSFVSHILFKLQNSPSLT